MGAYVGLSTYTPIFLQRVKGLNSAEAGLCLVPLMLGTVTGAWISGRLMGHVRHYKLITLSGLSLSLVALCVLTAGAADTGLLAVETLLIAFGFGMGTLFPVATNCVQNAVELHHLGVATAVLAFLRQLGSAIGVAVLGAVLFRGTAVSLAEGAKVSLLDRDAGSGGMASAFVSVFIGAAVSALAALVCFALMEEKPLRATTRHEPAPVPVQSD